MHKITDKGKSPATNVDDISETTLFNHLRKLYTGPTKPWRSTLGNEMTDKVVVLNKKAIEDKNISLKLEGELGKSRFSESS